MIILVTRSKQTEETKIICYQKLHGYPVATVSKYTEAIKHLTINYHVDNSNYLRKFFINWREFVINFKDNDKNSLIRYKYPHLVMK